MEPNCTTRSKGVVPRNQYVEIRQEKPKNKFQQDAPEYKTCKYTTKAIVADGVDKGGLRNRLIVHATANAQRTADLIPGSMFEEEKETTENAGDAAVSGSPAVVAMNIAPATYGHSHL